jgi:L-amino acid N-acyltransferase YncA
MLPADWPEVRRIYLEGVATNQATFETTVPETWEIWTASKLPSGRLMALQDRLAVGWAALSAVSSRPAYRGVAEVSVYVAAAARGTGVGRALLHALVEASEASGVWTLQASIFPENAASVRLHERAGFRVVGRRERIAQQHGVWRDTVLLERRSAIV